MLASNRSKSLTLVVGFLGVGAASPTALAGGDYAFGGSFGYRSGPGYRYRTPIAVSRPACACAPVRAVRYGDYCGSRYAAPGTIVVAEPRRVVVTEPVPVLVTTPRRYPAHRSRYYRRGPYYDGPRIVRHTRYHRTRAHVRRVYAPRRAGFHRGFSFGKHRDGRRHRGSSPGHRFAGSHRYRR